MEFMGYIEQASNKYKTHPLLLKESAAHYDATKSKLGKKNIKVNNILGLEETLTVPELIGACKFNIYKYKYRSKGQDDLDAKKAKSYYKYLIFLKAMYRICKKYDPRLWSKGEPKAIQLTGDKLVFMRYSLTDPNSSICDLYR